MLREMNTVKELNDLPFGAVVLDNEDNAWKALRTGWKGQWLWISSYGNELISSNLIHHGNQVKASDGRALFTLVSSSKDNLSSTCHIGTMQTYTQSELEALEEGTIFGAHETAPDSTVSTTIWRCDGDGTASLISHKSNTSEKLSFFSVNPERKNSGYFLTMLTSPKTSETKPEAKKLQASSGASAHGIARKVFEDLQARHPGTAMTYGDVIYCVEAGIKSEADKSADKS